MDNQRQATRALRPNQQQPASSRNRPTRGAWVRGASVMALAVAFAGTADLASTPAEAQTASSPATINFSIAAQPLASALVKFADATGFQLAYSTDLVKGLTTAGVNGVVPPREALVRLLAGTGLTARFGPGQTVIIERPIAGARTLGAVEIEGAQTDAFAALDGFGRGSGSNGSTDPTATEGTGSLTTNGASVASKTPQALKDTPQTVTVITSERIQQQNLTDLTSALVYTPGVTVVDSSGLNSTYLSRGFTVTTFQVDGGGPLTFSTYGSTPNLTEFDNIQVLRGSDGLFGGQGDPGGVVNLDRKRPLDHEQALGEVDAGSWDNYKVMGDITGPVAFDGHLRARLAVSDQDRDYFYDTAHQNDAFAYGVVEGDIGSNTVARAGFSYEKQTNTGYNSSGLPRYSDGGDLDLPRSTSFAAPWNGSSTTSPEFFAALDHRFNSDWGLKIDFTRKANDTDLTNSGVTGYVNRTGASSYAADELQFIHENQVQYSASATVNGAFQMLGLKQSLAFGADYSDSHNDASENQSNPVYVPINVFDFNPDSLNPEPAPGAFPETINTPSDTRQVGGYATLNLQPIQNFHLIGGVRVSSFRSDTELSIDIGGFPVIDEAVQSHADGVKTPYAAATYGLTHDITIYASYADIYAVQSGLLNPSGTPIPATATGSTYETGIKGSFGGGKLNASLSYFYTDKSNYAEQYQGICAIGFSCFVAGDLLSRGIDLEVTGEILPGWQVQAGYTYDDNRFSDSLLNAPGVSNGINSSFQTQQPVHQAKLWTSYTPIGRFNRWTVGGGLRLESSRSNGGTVCSVQQNALGCPSNVFVPYAFTQGLYTVIDLRTAYRFSDHWSAALNVTNVGDTRYYATAGTSQTENFYGEPRAVMFSLRAKY
jgi:outer membrane receptor for ferric coprogen and ferric-rhodotorulic acid